MPPDRPRRRGRLELLRAESRQPQLDPSPRASLWEALDIAKIRRKPQSLTRPSSGECRISCPLGRNHPSRTMKSMERADVEMIEVRVGKKHDVDLGEVANGQRGRGQAFKSERKSGQPDSDPRKKNWISENLYPEKID